MRLPENPPKWLIRYIFLTISFIWVSFYLVSIIKSLSDLILILIVSLFISAAIEQPVSKLSKKGMRRGVATGITLILFFGFTISLTLAGSSIFISQYQALKTSLPEQLLILSDLLNKFGVNIDHSEINGAINTFLEESIFNNAQSIIFTSLKVLINIFIAVFLIFYLVADGPKIRRTLCSLLPQNKQESFLSIWEEATRKAGGFFLVRTSMALYGTFFSFIFFYIVGLPYALPLALWVGIISQLIPAIGTYLASILPIIVSISYIPDKVIYILLFLILYQQFENYILTPKLSKNFLEIHPAVAFFSAIVGAIIAGFIGAIIAIPFVATLQAFLSSFFERYPLIDSKHFEEESIKKLTLKKKNLSLKKKNKKSIKNK
jgi:predicted PurR-regulated permease PerM